MNQDRKRVNVFVYNNCSKDARVLKEAETLTKAGYGVKIAAVLDNRVTEEYTKLNGFEIYRIKRDSLHVKVIGNFQKGFRLIEKMLLLPFRLLVKIIVLAYQAIRKLFSFSNRLSSIELATENSNRQKLVRLLRNPHRYELKDYFELVFFGHGFVAKTIGYIFGFSMLPFFLLGTLFFWVFELLRKNVFLALKKILVPFHRQSVFNDYYKKAAVFCEEHPADILHFHDLNTMPIIPHLKNPEAYKMVYDSHELYTEIHTLNIAQKKKYVGFERNLIHKVNRVITVNESIAGELVDRYGINRPVVVMNCPHKMTNLPAKTSLLGDKAGIKFGEIIILYQGGYSTGRGLEELILAMKHVNKGKLVMMGWGPIEYELKMIAEVNRLDEKVVFISPAEPSELLNYTCGADIGVIPYKAVGLNNYYTSPNKLFEYIQAGIPVAGSNFPELKRVITHYEIGELFDPESPESIADCLNKMTSNVEALQRMKENVSLAADRYNWENEEKKLLEVYKELG